MPHHRIAFRPSARRDFLALPRKIQRQVGKRIQALLVEPMPPGAKKLHGSDGFLRIRSGDYRVVYVIESLRLIVLVVRIGHRREVYR